MSGRLVVVGTPIGNLGDLTPRAAEALRNADLVAAEDTRMALRLLSHIGAKRAVVSYNDHSPEGRTADLLGRLGRGETIALTTDAGMPGVSDPGPRLVEAARAAGATIEVVPGPSAVTAAIAASGVEALGFVFGGFLPPRPASARRTALQRLLGSSGTAGMPLVLFEAPHRAAALLADLESLVPESRVAACRELTKLHEEVMIGTPGELRARLAAPRGELTFVISRIPPVATEAVGVDVRALVAAAESAGLPPRTVVELLRAAGVPRRAAYLASGKRDVTGR